MYDKLCYLCAVIGQKKGSKLITMVWIVQMDLEKAFLKK